MTPSEFNFIKDAFSQIIDDIAGNPDWQDAASAVASNLGTLERQLKEKVVELPSNLDEASEEYRNFREERGIKDPVMLNEIEVAYYVGAKWMAGQGETHELTVESPVLGPPMICCPVHANNGDKIVVQIRKK